MTINLAVGGGDYLLHPRDQFGNSMPLANLPDGVGSAPDGVFLILGGPEVEIVWKDGAAYLHPVSQGMNTISVEVLSSGVRVGGLGGQILVFIAPQPLIAI